MPKPTSPMEPLRNRKFLTYWLAGLSANFGWQIQLVGASWLMISLGGTPAEVAFVQTSVALPVMLLSIPGGAISDRVGQRTLTLWAQLFLLVVSTVLAIGAYLSLLTPTLLLACTFLVGSGRALYYPGWSSMVQEFFPRERAAAAFSINTGNLNIARSLGPAIGGAIVTAAGAFFTFVISALSNVSVLLVARKWSVAPPAHTLPPEPMLSAIMAGLRYTAMSPVLLIIILRSTVFNVAAIGVLALLPLVASETLSGGAQTFGVLLGAFGAGAVTGAFSSQILRKVLTLEWYLALAFLTYSGAMGLLGLSDNLVVSLAASVAAGYCWIVVQVTFGAMNQTCSPRWVMSRSVGLYQTCIFGGSAIGSVIWGLMAERLGIPASLGTAAILMAGGALLGLVLKVREPDTMALDVKSAWVPPTPNLDMVAASGPVVTTITYCIDEADAPAFLAVMHEKRRLRLRDGATRWTLSRDILDTSLWFERFKVATWADVQRLHSRRTVGSGLVIEALHKLHRGPTPPQVRYELVRDTTEDLRRPVSATASLDL